MHVRLLKLWDNLRSSYWFIPTLMTIGALAFAVATNVLDARLGSEWLESVPWLYASKPEGVRAILSTIAGSMITVAGVAFSITMVAVVYASGQYGPRLLSNFMRDTGNQITLGTFIATFLYCLQILRAVRNRNEVGGSLFEPLQYEGGFVPHIGMLGAFALTLCSIGVLIYFIHHVPGSIHISNVIGGVGKELQAHIADRFPERFGYAAEDDADAEVEVPAEFSEDAHCVEADGPGYIQAIDEEVLLEHAQAHDYMLRICCRPGDFVRSGTPLVELHPADVATDEVSDVIRSAFAWGRRRLPVQDFMFLVDELVEIAARALSPGVNDPFTATTCLDWLSVGVAAFAARDIPEARRLDSDGQLRVLARPVTFAEFVEAAFGQLRPYVAADRNAALHMLGVLGGLATSVDDASRRDILREHAAALVAAAEETSNDPASLDLIRDRYGEALRMLAGTAAEQPVVS